MASRVSKVSASESLNVMQGVAQYVDRALDQIGGMKVLLLDKETTGIVSMVYSQSQILEREVYLTKLLEPPHERMMHLKAVVLVRPTAANFRMLVSELADPHFGEYHLLFANMVRDDMLQQLASADLREVVKSVQEFYADYYATTTSLFSLNLANSLVLSAPASDRTRTGHAHALYKGIYQRSIDGLSALLLSFKKRPNVIRYSGSSALAENFSRDMKSHMDKHQEVFDFRLAGGGSGAASAFGGSGSTLLLVLDRRDDPVTPLLTQWTYQAMVHELLGIENNKVNVQKSGTGEPETIVLATSDPFFEKHMHSNLGELCDAVKQLMDQYQKMTHSNKSLSTMEDMQRFVEQFPEMRKVANNTSKHVTLVTELSRIIGTHELMQISQLEQELACASDHSAQLHELIAKLSDSRTAREDAIRLVMLYALRYESYTGNRIKQLKDLLREKCAADEGQIALVDALIAYAGVKKRGGDLFGDSTLLSKSLKMATRAVKGMADVYTTTQHKPMLAKTLDLIAKGRLKEAGFPMLVGTSAKDKPSNIVVFMLGGTTFVESASVAEFNKGTHGIRAVLGGTCIHNSKSFLQEIAAVGNFR